MNQPAHDKQNEIIQTESQPPSQSGSVTPDKMLQMAVEQGADLDKLEKLMDLQERWEKSEAKKAFVSAMNRFKANPPKLVKNHKVDYTNTKGQRTHYNHATLDHICEVIGSALSEVGISYRWQTEQMDNGAVRVTCILTHESGHSEETPLQADPDQSGGKNSIQAVGSTVTYLERYTLLAATGMAAEDQDDDGQAASKVQAAAASRTITEAQVKQLRDTAKSVGIENPDEYICEKAHVADVHDIQSGRFQAALNHLKKLANGGES